jgi:hypothetical protein
MIRVIIVRYEFPLLRPHSIEVPGCSMPMFGGYNPARESARSRWADHCALLFVSFAMSRIASRLIAALLLIAYTVTGIGPRGSALCLGGGHDWDEVIALHCDHGGHRHDGGHAGDAECEHAVSECAGCEHHHDEEHGPCTDIPLDADESRPSAGQTTIKMSDVAASEMGMLPAWSFPELRLSMIARTPHQYGDSPRTPLQVTVSLRAVVLLL